MLGKFKKYWKPIWFAATNVGGIVAVAVGVGVGVGVTVGVEVAVAES